MSRATSIEVFRDIFYANQHDFVASVGTLGRAVLDTQRRQVVTPRTDNIMRQIVQQASLVYPNLRYVHARAVGENAKHLNRKMNDARVVIEDGNMSNGIEPLASSHSKIASAFFGQDAPLVLFYEKNLDEVEIISQLTARGPRNFIVLRSSSTDTTDQDDASTMLREMSDVTKTFIEDNASFRVSSLLVAAVADTVPIARIDSADTYKAEVFADNLRELLPIQVQVSSDLSIDTSS